MKKIIFSVSICLLCAGFASAQQQDSTFLKGSKSTNDKMIEKNKDKNYSDSSNKYAPYGDPNSKKNSKNKNKRDNVDSINPRPKM